MALHQHFAGGGHQFVPEFLRIQRRGGGKALIKGFEGLPQPPGCFSGAGGFSEGHQFVEGLLG